MSNVKNSTLSGQSALHANHPFKPQKHFSACNKFLHSLRIELWWLISEPVIHGEFNVSDTKWHSPKPSSRNNSTVATQYGQEQMTKHIPLESSWQVLNLPYSARSRTVLNNYDNGPGTLSATLMTCPKRSSLTFFRVGASPLV